jgi:hypothetical protein
MPTSENFQINAKHAKEHFADDPKIIETALSCGARSIYLESELPQSLRHLRDELPGLLIWNYPLGGGEPVPSFWPDNPDPIQVRIDHAQWN